MARHPRTNVPQTLCGGFALLSVLSCSASQPAGQGVSIPEASRPVDSPGCTRAHAVEQQLDTWFKEGRLDRLVTRASLAGSECPGSNLGTHPLVRRARRDLSASAAPEALLADARRAREHGDRVAARRLFSQALAAAELADRFAVFLNVGNDRDLGRYFRFLPGALRVF